MKKSKAILILLGILFISFNLRAPITAVGTIREMIQNEYALSSAATGFITTLPLIAFAVVSPFVSGISAKIGHAKIMLIGLLLILIGVPLRSYTGAAGLFIGTGIIGVGIAIGNVIIPSIIKLYFPEKAGLVSSVYTTGMCVFASVGAGISVPLAEGAGLGWKNSLSVWVILTLVTILIWLPQLREKAPQKKAAASTGASEKTTSIWKSPLAWWVTLYMGTQSLLFYSLTAWLSSIVSSKVPEDGFGSSMAFLFQLMAIPATLIIPALCDKWKDQRFLACGVCAIYALGGVLLLTGSTRAVLTTSVVLMSLGMGGSIALSIAFISLRSPNPQRAAQLSGMSQSAGYLFAAVGPFLTGFIYDLTPNWSIPVILFIALIVFLAFCGMFAGRGMVDSKNKKA